MLDILGSKKRLQILKILSREDRYVSQIMDLADMDGKRAKHHLEKLESEGLIESYMDGRRKYYKLKKEIHLEITPPPEGKFLVYTSE
ncbi:MAG: ArsR/SmtB family transcription factor [Candidatus Aenigmatarchaeota archaeon]